MIMIQKSCIATIAEPLVLWGWWSFYTHKSVGQCTSFTLISRSENESVWTATSPLKSCEYIQSIDNKMGRWWPGTQVQDKSGGQLPLDLYEWLLTDHLFTDSLPVHTIPLPFVVHTATTLCKLQYMSLFICAQGNTTSVSCRWWLPWGYLH